VLLGPRECGPGVRSGGCFGRTRVGDAKNHSGLDAKQNRYLRVRIRKRTASTD
jgi:hypothetical protein